LGSLQALDARAATPPAALHNDNCDNCPDRMALSGSLIIELCVEMDAIVASLAERMDE
jgi:hypothetical protein